MKYTPWNEIDEASRAMLDAAVADLKARGASDVDINDAVQRKLDQLEPIEEPS